MAWRDLSRERLSSRGSVTAIVLIVVFVLAVLYALFWHPMRGLL